MIKILLILVSIFSITNAKDINIDIVINNAKKSHQHVLVFLHRPGCSYCETMIEFTLPDAEIAQKIKKNFIFVDIDIGDSGKVTFDEFKGNRQEFAKYLGYNFYPSAVFIDKNKDIVYGEAGYKDEEKFLKILRFVESHSYEDMDIDDFK